MEKLEFIEKAPMYYAVGIAKGLAYLARTRGGPTPVTKLDIESAMGLPGLHFEANSVIWARAVAILVSNDIIATFPDDFGPTLYQATNNTEEWAERPPLKSYPWVERYLAAGDNWLHQALASVNDAYGELDISERDFKAADSAEWEPIAIERGDPKLEKASNAVESALGQIEGDNGYAVHAPGEREYVISSLQKFQTHIRERAVIYAREVKTLALDPLLKVMIRFGDAGAGIAAKAARDALYEWIKAHAAKLLGLLFN